MTLDPAGNQTMIDASSATAVFRVIHEGLQATEKTREPMNALILWTELGKGLAGKLERQGADRGLLQRLVVSYCKKPAGGDDVDPRAWAYRVEPETRMNPEEAGQALGRIQRDIENHLLADSGETGGDEKQREYFLATVRGWFPIAFDILRAMPALRHADGDRIRAALAGWCQRYLPRDESGPKELGVRMTKA